MISMRWSRTRRDSCHPLRRLKALRIRQFDHVLCRHGRELCAHRRPRRHCRKDFVAATDQAVRQIGQMAFSPPPISRAEHICRIRMNSSLSAASEVSTHPCERMGLRIFFIFKSPTKFPDPICLRRWVLNNFSSHAIHVIVSHC